MTTADLDSFLARALQFTPDDLQQNRGGAVSAGQVARLQHTLGTQQRSAIRLFAIVGVICIAGLAREAMRKGGPALADLANLGPALIIPIAVVVLYGAGILFFLLRGHKLSAHQRIQMVEGKARINLASGSYETKALIRQSGLNHMSGKLSIGRKTFYVDEATLRAFKPGATYRIFFITHHFAPIIVSAETLADA